jgi:hypothetical protein
MNRRGFLQALGGLGVGVVAGAELAELLAPTRTIFLPPRGGWHSDGRIMAVDWGIDDTTNVVLYHYQGNQPYADEAGWRQPELARLPSRATPTFQWCLHPDDWQTVYREVSAYAYEHGQSAPAAGTLKIVGVDVIEHCGMPKMAVAG